MTGQVEATLLGAGVGGAIGFISSYAVRALADRRRDQAVRAQIVSLMRVLEQRMLVVANHGGIPLDKWIILDLLTERGFSTDGAEALKGELHEPFMSVLAKLQVIRGSLDYTSERLRDPNQGSERERRRKEIRAAGQHGVDVLKEMRTRLGDTEIVEDPVVDADEYN